MTKLFRHKYFALFTALVSYILLALYLFKSMELTTTGIVLVVLILVLNTLFLFGTITNNHKLSLKSAQILLGVVFIFSGFVKAVDPMGFYIKITDYLHAFNAPGLIPLALLAAYVLSCYEFPLGIGILFGAKGKLMSWLLLIIMLPFLFLTLYLAIENPVTDCGCFGDALILSNWETFYKNIIIILFVFYIVGHRKDIVSDFKGVFGSWGILSMSVVFIVIIAVYSKTHLPLIDFRPYKVGGDIQKLMEIPEDEEGDVYETRLLYKNTNTGEIQEYDLENIPMDGPWEWQETINKLVKKGYKPPIHDFHISTSNGNDLTSYFLSKKGYKLFIIQDKLDRTFLKGQEQLNKLVSSIDTNEIQIWPLSSSLEEEKRAFIEQNNVPYSFYRADLVMLETMIRSNPGLILLKDNVILKKWSCRDIPTIQELKAFIE